MTPAEGAHGKVCNDPGKRIPLEKANKLPEYSTILRADFCVLYINWLSTLGCMDESLYNRTTK